MWDETVNPLFSLLAPSRISHLPEVAALPETVDQEVRIDLLAIIMALHHPRAKAALETFLRSHLLGTSYLASTLLLEEGGEEALSLLHQLMDGGEPIVRIQSALALAGTTKDPYSIALLQREYPLVDRSLQLSILQFFGEVSTPEVRSFLLSKFADPHQTVRVTAAASLLRGMRS